MSQISLIRHGGLLADIDDAIRECVREVCEKGKSGIEDTSRLIFTLELRDLQQLLEQLREEIVADLKEKAGDTPVFLTVD